MTSYRVTTMTSPLQNIYQDCFQAAEDRNALAKQLDLLSASLSSEGQTSSLMMVVQMKHMLASQQKSLANAMLRTTAIIKPPPPSSERAHQVLSTPELLELILSNTGNNTALLSAYRVNRHFFQVIEGSPKLQRRLGLLPETKNRFSLPHSGMRPWDLRHGEDMNSISGSGPTTLLFDLAGTATLGSRCQSMLFCQPPVQSMTYLTACCGTGVESVNGEGTLAAKPGSMGIAVDDANELLMQLTANHILCPSADSCSHDEDGFVKCRVYFTAKFDVILEPSAHQKKKRLEDTERSDALKKKWDEVSEYKSAKREGDTSHL